MTDNLRPRNRLLGLYRHYLGDHYRLLGIDVYDEATGALLCVYECTRTGKRWARPYTEFFGMTEDRGRLAPRFARVDQL